MSARGSMGLLAEAIDLLKGKLCPLYLSQVGFSQGLAQAPTPGLEGKPGRMGNVFLDSETIS